MENPFDIHALCEEVCRISREVGKFILLEQKRLSDHSIESKGLNDFVTYVDKAAETLLVSELKALLPTSGFLTEEKTVEQQESDYVWIIDPIDGTLLKEQFIMTAAGETVTSVNAATNLNKLLQVATGAAYTDDGNTVEFDITNRYNVLLEAIEESTHKVLVFVPFRHAITVLQERLIKDGYAVDVIHGGVPVAQRTRVFSAFQTQPEPRVLLIQPQAAAHGVTLHAANTVVWWGPVTSNETYHQANARVHRAGQKNPCLVVRLCGCSVERKLYEALDLKTEDMATLLDLYREEVLDRPKVHA